MRTFNPEKELRKIQKGNKNKVIISVCLSLLIIAIGSSYALYQIRYSKQIIYTTVQPFYSKDIQISVYVNGKEQESFPDKEENYSYSGYECEKGSTVTFNYNDWMAEIKSTGPDKCKINFETKNNFYDTLIASENVIIDETNDANLRYIGATPANYIWFNCDDYNNLDQENAKTKCEKWRIIGIMNNMTTVDEDTNKETPNQSLVKIIRAESIGNIPWNNTNSNNWAEASLQKGLNGPYLEDTDNGNWITSKEYTYNGQTNTVADDYKSITSLTLGMIENVKWNIGGFLKESQILPLLVYEYERGTGHIGSTPITWNGKIALMYVSDFGLATNGNNNEKDRSDCLATELYLDFRSCSLTDWLTPSNSANSLSLYGSEVKMIEHAGYIDCFGNMALFAEYPTLYLKPSIKISSGNGNAETPYILAL